MEQFRSLSLILMSLLLCVCFTDGTIDTWQLNLEAPESGPNAAIAVTVAETSDVTTVLFTLTATAATGTAVASYAITNEPTAGQFKIGQFGTADAGKVQLETAKCIDYEAGTPIEIEVTATDDTTPNALSGVATVTITITDVTTYTPVFTTPSTVTTCVEIPDQAAVGDAVYTVVAVVATDVVTSTITYSIDSGNTDTDFAIDGTSGAITVANALDKAITPFYCLVVYGTATTTTTPTCIEIGSVLVVVSVGMPCPCPGDNGAGTAAVSVITLMTGIFLFELM